MLRIAQISDLHVRRRLFPKAQTFDAYLTECISRVNATAPDFVIATGDLAHTGSDEEYRRLRELMSALSCPYYVMPGNHDDPRALRRIFSDRAYLFETDNHVSYTVDAGDHLILMLDSTKSGRPGGYLDSRRLEWLSSQLRKRSNVPVLLALHHPPFAAGVWPMDWLGFINLSELEKLVRTNPQIRRIVSGHVHCARTATWGGTVAYTSPSIIPQRLLVGIGWNLPKMHFEHPGFLLHTLDGGSDIVTQVHRVSGTIENL